MDQNITFLTGLGCGLCLGMSLFAFRRYLGISGIFSKTAPTSKPQTAATAKKFSINNEYRLALVVRSDLQMTKGKVATQCGHASVMAFEQAAQKDPDGTEFWKSIGQTKILREAGDLCLCSKMDGNGINTSPPSSPDGATPPPSPPRSPSQPPTPPPDRVAAVI